MAYFFFHPLTLCFERGDRKQRENGIFYALRLRGLQKCFYELFGGIGIRERKRGNIGIVDWIYLDALDNPIDSKYVCDTVLGSNIEIAKTMRLLRGF